MKTYFERIARVQTSGRRLVFTTDSEHDQDVEEFFEAFMGKRIRVAVEILPNLDEFNEPIKKGKKR